MDGIVSLAIPYLYIAHVLVITLRVGSALMFAPIWGHPGIPQTMRLLLVFTMAVGLATMIPFNPESYSAVGLILPTELLIGLLLSMGIRIAFAGLHMAGQLVSFHLGFSAVQAIDPQTQNRSTLVSAFMTLLGYMLILATDQHHQMLRAITSSYQTFPIGSTIHMSQWFDSLMAAAAQVFLIGWKISLPVFVATFLIELTVGLVSRMQPQINSMVVTAPLKLLVGMAVFGASLAFLPQAVSALMNLQVLHK